MHAFEKLDLDLSAIDRSIFHILFFNVKKIFPTGFDKYTLLGTNIKFTVNTTLSHDLRQNLVVAIENGGHLAFGHFFFESVVLAHSVWRQHNLNTDSKVYLSEYRKYKHLTLDYININATNEIPSDSALLVANRKFSLNTDSNLLDLSDSLKRFLSEYLKLHNEKSVHTCFMPRQKNENLKENDRILIYNGFDRMLETVPSKITIHTDVITSFGEQVDLVNSSKYIIVPDGSAFLVNGFLASNSVIIVLGGDLVPIQQQMYPKLKKIYKSIRSRNSVIFVRPRGDGYNAEDIIPILENRFFF
jgi:hypothetical protein